MNLLELDQLLRYWVGEQWQANVLILLHLLGALVLGLVLGYERAYHGRAAGMRTYALVCMAATGVVILLGYPQQWYGGHLHAGAALGPGAVMAPDPSRVVQGVVTGIGFLCAGVIMREGMNISGLTTAASIWAASAIGILLGTGFYFAAISLTLLCASLMMWGAKLENMLPSHPAIAVTLRGQPGHAFVQAELAVFADQHGYRFAPGSLSIERTVQNEEWRFVCTAKRNYGGDTLTRFSSQLPQLPGVAEYRVTHARN
jgi:putative Mg2+ transporter-C (MgtC) family protein